ncbi:MAG: Ig-like domain-containing protein [Chloroflexota bacterium]
MRRLISLISAFVALAGLGFVLVNATTVDRRPPAVKAITLSATAGDPHLAQTLTAIDIEFSEPVRPETAESRFHINPTVDGAFAWDGSRAIFTPSGTLPSNTTFSITVDPGVEDLEGNVDPLGLEEWSFATVGPPMVLRATPADGATGVSLDGSLELVFDRLMDTASVESAITLDPAGPVSATWRGSVVTLQFDGGLRLGSTYHVTVGASAADTGGSRLGAPFVVAFTTVGTDLGIAQLIPADGVAGIGVGTAIAIRFDGPIDPDSVREALHVTPEVGGGTRIVALPGTNGAAPDGVDTPTANALVFSPSIPLAPHTTYTITLDPVVARLGDPGAVNRARTWTFTTGAPPSSGQNQIGFLSDRGGVRNVWVMNPDGTNQRAATTDLEHVTSFDASADGGRLLYASGGGVWVMSIDGSGLQRITRDDGRIEYAPAFAPGDTRALVARTGPLGEDLGYWLVPLPGTPGRERQVLDRGVAPLVPTSMNGTGLGAVESDPAWMPRVAFEPDGRAALLVTSTGQVMLLDLADPTLLGSEPADPVPVGLTAQVGPSWVPARGAFVLSATTGSGPPAMYAVRAGGSVVLLPGTEGAIGPATVGPDGAIALVVSLDDGRTALRVLALDGRIDDLATSGASDDRSPSFAPDGRSLLVGRSPAATPTISQGIWRLDLDTGLARQLTPLGTYGRWIP